MCRKSGGMRKLYSSTDALVPKTTNVAMADCDSYWRPDELRLP